MTDLGWNSDQISLTIFCPICLKIIGLIIETELVLEKVTKMNSVNTLEFIGYEVLHCAWWALRKVPPHFYMDPFLGAAPKLRDSRSCKGGNEFKHSRFVIIDSWEVVWSPVLRWLPGRLYACRRLAEELAEWSIEVFLWMCLPPLSGAWIRLRQ